MKQIIFLLMVFFSSSAFAGWRLLNCEIVSRTGVAEFFIIGTHEMTQKIQIEPFGPYNSEERALAVLDDYRRIGHCASSQEVDSYSGSHGNYRERR
jgi:hypothetical protein